MLNDSQRLQFSSQQFTCYQADFTFAASAAVGTTGEASGLRISDVDFICTRVMIASRDTTTGALISTDSTVGAGNVGGWPDPCVILQIHDTGSQKDWFDRPIDGLALGFLGTRGLPVPRWVKASSTITCPLTLVRDLAANALQVRVIFEGYHQY